MDGPCEGEPQLRVANTLRCLPYARARERVVPISELVFGTLTQNRSSLMPELNVIPSRLPFAKSTAKGPPFSMRGVLAQDYSCLG